MKQKWFDRCFNVPQIILAVIFIPVLLGVYFVGNKAPYIEYLKIDNAIPNWGMFLMIIPLMAVILFVSKKAEKKPLSSKVSLIISAVIVALFVGLYFLNLWIAREIAFHLPWDVSVVSGAAWNYAIGEPMGQDSYFSVYSNNIPIVYVLGKIYSFAAKHAATYPYPTDFIWIQVNCIMFSVAGIFTCFSVKKLTDNVVAEILTFFIYVALVGISPWKIEPYTDAYGLVFPIASLYFYLSYRKSERKWVKCVCLVLSMLIAAVGGFIKPNLHIFVIAIVVVELIRFLADIKGRWLYAVIMVLMIPVLIFGVKAGKNAVVRELGAEINKEVGFDWHHYFFMGQNPDTTGSYSVEDVQMLGKHQHSKAERIEVEKQLSIERLREKGFFGNLKFWWTKLVMTFNDGTFGWEVEVWHDSEFPDSLATQTFWTVRLRGIFWGENSNSDLYTGGVHFIWLLCLFGIPGLCIERKKERPGLILTLSLLGLILYQMLFEARARYLFAFIPVIVVASVYGMMNYVSILEKKKGNLKK